MAEHYILNAKAPVILNTEAGELRLAGDGKVTKVTQEQYKALMKKSDFKIWVEKGYIIIDPALKNVRDINSAVEEEEVAEQEKASATIQLETLADSIMLNEGVTNREDAIAEARKRLEEKASSKQVSKAEAEKAAQASKAEATSA